MTATTGPVALVTGATRGLGRAIAEALASDHHVLVGGRDAGAVARVVSELPSASPFVADLTDAAATEEAVRGCVVPLGRLDVLVHNAGIAERGRFPAIDLMRSVSRSLPAAATPGENAQIA